MSHPAAEAQPPRATLSDLTTRVALRLGYVAAGQASNIQRPLIEDFLRDACIQLAEQVPQEFLRERNMIKVLQDGEIMYDLPTHCDPLRVNRVMIRVPGTSEGGWAPLHRGLSGIYSLDAPAAMPCRWDFSYGTSDRGQVQVWPTPDQEYETWWDYYRRVDDFTGKTEPCPIYPEHLVFLHALANAKAFYGQQDAQVVFAQLESMLKKIRKAHFNGKRFVIGTKYDGHEEPGAHHPYRVESGTAVVDTGAIVTQSDSIVVTE